MIGYVRIREPYVRWCERSATQITGSLLLDLSTEREGFEPSIRFRITVFETVTFDLSDISPQGEIILYYQRKCKRNYLCSESKRFLTSHSLGERST